MQLSQGIFLVDRTTFTLSKIAFAEAASFPVVVAISKNRDAILPRFTSIILTVSGFIFFTPVSFEPSMLKEYGDFYMMLTSSVWKHGAIAPFRMKVVFVLAQW
jgi:hypothetical protein